MNNYNVSIVVPVYNVQQYLERCLQSLIAQELESCEIILVDDESPDESPRICDEYAAKYDNIKVVHKKNAGLGEARNSGLLIATGDYVGFVDSDDYVDKSMFKSLYCEAVCHDADIVYSGRMNEQSNGSWEKKTDYPVKTILKGDQITQYMLDMVATDAGVKKERLHSMCVWRAIFRRSLIVNNSLRFNSERKVVCEDIPFQIQALKLSSCVICIPSAFYYYCINGNSLTSTFVLEKYDRFKTLRNIQLSLLSNIKGGQDRANRFFIGMVRSYLYNLTKSNRKDKSKIISYIINDPVWDNIDKCYPPQKLPLVQSCIYRLILKKQLVILRLFLYITHNFR